VVDIVGTARSANKLQFIDKDSLEVVRTIEVAGRLGQRETALVQPAPAGPNRSG